MRNAYVIKRGSSRVSVRAALALLAVLNGSGHSMAQPAREAVQSEIEHLVGYLEQSGCRFNRNGTWYTATEAKDHLAKKQSYLVRKGLLTTTESFIELAASKSSLSGKPYLVACSGVPVQESARWFSEELARFRHLNR